MRIFDGGVSSVLNKSYDGLYIFTPSQTTGIDHAKQAKGESSMTQGSATAHLANFVTYTYTHGHIITWREKDMTIYKNIKTRRIISF